MFRKPRKTLGDILYSHTATLFIAWFSAMCALFCASRNLVGYVLIFLWVSTICVWLANEKTK